MAASGGRGPPSMKDLRVDRKRAKVTRYAGVVDDDDDFTEESLLSYRDWVALRRGKSEKPRVAHTRGAMKETNSSMANTGKGGRNNVTMPKGSKKLNEIGEKSIQNINGQPDKAELGGSAAAKCITTTFEAGVLHGFELFRAYARKTYPEGSWDIVDVEGASN